MRDQPIDIRQGNASLFADLIGRSGQRGDSQLEHSLTVHAQEGIAHDLAVRDIACRTQNTHLAAIRIELGGQNTGLITGLQNHSARTVAKQDAGRAVVPVQDAGEHFGADNQRVFNLAAANHRFGDGHTVNKA